VRGARSLISEHELTMTTLGGAAARAALRSPRGWRVRRTSTSRLAVDRLGTHFRASDRRSRRGVVQRPSRADARPLRPTADERRLRLRSEVGRVRAIVSTAGPLRVRSRRRWDMTEHVGFLAELPVRAVLDGELVALDEDGKPDFPQLCECVLTRHRSTPLTFIPFDVLSVEGEPVVSRQYSERRRILEELRLNSPQWRTPDVFDDGEALWTAVVEHELEGLVAKRRSGRYVPGGRAWIKTKNQEYWRYEMECEGAIKINRERQFV
jgi:ATP dependent DNA ligase domain